MKIKMIIFTLFLPYVLIGHSYELREKVNDHLKITMELMKTVENEEMKTFLLGQFVAYRTVLQEINLIEDSRCGQ